MTFGERLKKKRLEAGLKQVDLAKIIDVSERTIQNYELNTSRPRTTKILRELADAVHTEPEYLSGVEGLYILDAYEKGGEKAAVDMELLVDRVRGLFAGGQLDEDSMDGAMQALSEAYWEAKAITKKKKQEEMATSSTEE